jgi:hypothetical protein
MDDFYEDSEVRGTFSFADIGRLEAVKTSDALLSIEEQLLIEPKPMIENDNNEMKVENDSDLLISLANYPRYESNGYDAHSESVNEEEIEAWQRAFKYLLVKGERINENLVVSRESFEESFIVDDNSNQPPHPSPLLPLTSDKDKCTVSVSVSINGGLVLVLVYD